MRSLDIGVVCPQISIKKRRYCPHFTVWTLIFSTHVCAKLEYHYQSKRKGKLRVEQDCYGIRRACKISSRMALSWRKSRFLKENDLFKKK